MKLLKENNVQLLSHKMLDYFDIQEYKDIISFALEDIDLSDDVSSEKDRIDLENYPYLVQPLSKCAIQQGIRKEVVIAFPQQFGKSMLQMVAILYNTVFNVMQTIICYPSLQLAVETSTVKFIPLFKKIKQFEAQLDKPFAIRNDRLKLSKNLIYWQGAGSKIVSKSCKMVLADEASIFETPNNVNNLEQLKKRTRSYSQSLALFVSTPRYKEDNFWRQFLGGSQGYYYLRCQQCGQLTMRSADLHNLQFESVFNEQLKQYVVKRGTERLICPKCHYEHDESFREKLVKQGAYIHKYQDRVQHYPTYQAGVLASLLNVHSWSTVADRILSSGKGAELSDYITLDNSYRGLPYQMREYRKQEETALSKHFYQPQELKQEDIEAVYIVADTQDLFSVLGVFAFTKQDNLYLLELARPRFLFLDDEERKIIDAENKRNGKPPQITVLDYIEDEYYGFKPLCALIDVLGHRTDEIKNFSKLKKNILMYAGTSLKFQKWKISQHNPKMFMCDARKFQADLIFRLYQQNNRESNFLFLPKTLSDKDLEQITCVQPNNEKRNGHLYQNWQPLSDAVHDCFDVLKMALAVVAISSRIYRRERFAHGEARALNTQNIKIVKKPTLNKPKQFIQKPTFNSSLLLKRY